MQKLDLQTLEIFILLKCNNGKKSRTDFSQIGRVRREGKEKTEQAISNLIDKSFILRRELPKLGAGKIPVFYEITDKGKAWVNKYSDYLKS